MFTRMRLLYKLSPTIAINSLFCVAVCGLLSLSVLVSPSKDPSEALSQMDFSTDRKGRDTFNKIALTFWNQGLRINNRNRLRAVPLVGRKAGNSSRYDDFVFTRNTIIADKFRSTTKLLVNLMVRRRDRTDGIICITKRDLIKVRRQKQKHLRSNFCVWEINLVSISKEQMRRWMRKMGHLSHRQFVRFKSEKMGKWLAVNKGGRIMVKNKLASNPRSTCFQLKSV